MSFPNPAMLPLIEAGGAISGANFGVFYTVLMQVGYKHFAPTVLKRLNEGWKLFDALMEVQEELRPFNDRIITDAVNRLPTMLDITVEMLERFIQERAKTGAENIKGGLGLIDFMKSMFPNLPEAEARRGSRQTTGSITNLLGTKSLSTQSTISGLTVVQAREQARQKQLQHEMELREKAKLAVELRKTVQPTPQIAKTNLTGKKKAGPSQMRERKKLITLIAQSVKLGNAQHVRILQQKLVNLLARYRF